MSQKYNKEPNGASGRLCALENCAKRLKGKDRVKGVFLGLGLGGKGQQQKFLELSLMGSANRHYSQPSSKESY